MLTIQYMLILNKKNKLTKTLNAWNISQKGRLGFTEEISTETDIFVISTFTVDKRGTWYLLSLSCPCCWEMCARASSMGSRANANLAFSYVAILLYSSQAFHHIFFLISPPHLPSHLTPNSLPYTTTLKNTFFFYSHPGVTDALHICLRVLPKTD